MVNSRPTWIRRKVLYKSWTESNRLLPWIILLFSSEAQPTQITSSFFFVYFYFCLLLLLKEIQIGLFEIEELHYNLPKIDLGFQFSNYPLEGFFIPFDGSADGIAAFREFRGFFWRRVWLSTETLSCGSRSF